MIQLVLKLWSKLRDVGQLLRYGPTRIRELTASEIRFQQQHVQHAENMVQLAQSLERQLNQERQALRQQLQQDTQNLRDHLSALQLRMQSLTEKAGTSGLNEAAATPCISEASPLATSFYLALEREFRGSPQSVRDRLQVYRLWLNAAFGNASHHADARMADLGCGRGEWLRLLGEWGVPAIGVDSNPLNVEHLRQEGILAECDDAVTWLARQPDASLRGITAFHVAEHLPFDALLALADHARRVLQPGGLLILETPNPENLLVATQSFWIDPTHVRPLPPVLLEFVVRHAGLDVQRVERLHPPDAGAVSGADPALQQLLGAGRDYAVIARKPLAPPVLAAATALWTAPA